MDQNQQAVELFNKLAQRYQDSYMNVKLYAKTLDSLCLALPSQAQVLDIACGPGNISRYLLDKRADITLLGLDLAPKMVELAKINNPEAEFILMDCREISSLATQIPMQFDAIVCGFCLPYLSPNEVIALFKDIHGLLKADGIMYLSTMVGKYQNSGLQSSSSGEQLYIHYHELNFINQMLDANFVLLSHTSQGVSNPTPGLDVQDYLLIARKKS
jgi:2-polyprenyl-3-methyl-5-hydroxy-6-metoxy-1,4-benzoquinol methylase